MGKTATRFSKTTSIPSTSRPTTIPRMDEASGTRSTEEAAVDTARVNADAEALENSDALLENYVHPVDITSDNDTEDADDDTDDDGIPRMDEASGTRSTEEAAADTARVNADAEALENSDALLENDVHPVDITSDNDTEDADIPRMDVASGTRSTEEAAVDTARVNA